MFVKVQLTLACLCFYCSNGAEQETVDRFRLETAGKLMESTTFNGKMNALKELNRLCMVSDIPIACVVFDYVRRLTLASFGYLGNLAYR